MKKLFLPLLIMLLPLAAKAYDAKIGRVYYNLNAEDKTAEVTYLSDSESNQSAYTGSLYISRTVLYNSVTYTVTRIGQSAFSGCSGLTAVTIPTTVSAIGKSAFEGCTSLTSISLPAALTVISDGTFYGCSSLKSMIIPDGITAIGEGAFGKCGSLTSVLLPKTVNSIGSSAFALCPNLTQVISQIQQPFGISPNVFSNYSAATLIVPKGMKTIYLSLPGWGAFSNIYDSTSENPTKRDIHVAVAGTLSYFIPEEEKNQIEELTLSGELNGTDFRLIREMAGVSSSSDIDNGAIYTATDGRLKSLDLSEAHIVRGGGYYVYTDVAYDCTGDDCVDAWYTKDNSISEYLFFGTKLESITLPQTTESIGDYAFNACSALTSIAIPNTVTSIAATALTGTGWYLEQPEGVVYVGNMAYKYKGDEKEVTSITLNKGTSRVTDAAFSDCVSLTSILCLDSEPPACGNKSFSGVDKSKCVLWVPTGCVKAYQAADGWRAFLNVREVIEGDVNLDQELNNADVKAVAASIVGHNTENFHVDLADVTHDGQVNTTDVVKLAEMVSSYGLSVDLKPSYNYINGTLVSFSLFSTLYNQRNRSISLTSCMLYCNSKLVSYVSFSAGSGTVESGASKNISFTNLSNLPGDGIFSIWYYYDYNGESFLLRKKL